MQRVLQGAPNKQEERVLEGFCGARMKTCNSSHGFEEDRSDASGPSNTSVLFIIPLMSFDKDKIHGPKKDQQVKG